MPVHAIEEDGPSDGRYELDLITPSSKFDQRHGGFVIHGLQGKHRDHRLADGQPENILEHTGAVAMAALMRLDERPDLDPFLILALALLHDVVESVTGDISIRDEVGLALKAALEEKGWDHLVPILVNKQVVLKLIRQLRDGGSPEWRFVKGIDHVENMDAIMRHGGRTWADHEETFETIVGSEELYKASIDPIAFRDMRGLLEEVGAHPERYSLPPISNARGLLKQAVKDAVERRVKQEELELEEKEQREREESQSGPGLRVV